MGDRFGRQGKAQLNAIIQAKKDGSLNLRESGFEKVKLGLTSIPEVIAATMDE